MYIGEKTEQVLIDDGFQSGMQQGAKNERKITARKLALRGDDVDDIADLLGESVETVTRWLVEAGLLTPANT